MAKDIRHPELYADIVAYCAARGIAPTRFGKDALRDPSLISNLENGRELRMASQAAIRRYMATGEPCHPARRRQSA